MRFRYILRNSALFAQLLVVVALVSAKVVSAEPVNTPAAIEGKLQALVTKLKSRLKLTPAVVVSVVPSNALMMSVEAPPVDSKKPFVLSIDANFLSTLTDDEIEAAVAHELGHVWIFTHHPYLQTEELANQIAMRAVSRESLERVYAKVWERGGTKGDLARFLGAKPAAAGLATDSSR
jgi:hypothetical protein